MIMLRASVDYTLMNITYKCFVFLLLTRSWKLLLYLLWLCCCILFFYFFCSLFHCLFCFCLFVSFPFFVLVPFFKIWTIIIKFIIYDYRCWYWKKRENRTKRKRKQTKNDNKQWTKDKKIKQNKIIENKVNDLNSLYVTKTQIIQKIF